MDNSLDAPRQLAAQLYWRGFTLSEISRELDTPRSTVQGWHDKEEWSKAEVWQRMQACIYARMNCLIAKESKSDRDYNEMQRLGAEIERTERMRKHAESGKPSDLNPKLERKGKRGGRKPKNFLDEDQIEQIRDHVHSLWFLYQHEWYEHRQKHPIRFYLKSRQIGATFALAAEALLTAIDTGKDQIFISASKAQAHVFKTNIIKIVLDACGVELKGDPIILGHNRAALRFLGTNKNTAQSYSGDLYIDEAFWIANFAQIEHVASGMTVLDDRSLTYFSTTSHVGHQAYPIWTGEAYNADRPKSEHVDIDVSHKALKHGKLCADGIFRQIITIHDAIERGNNLITLDKLKKKFGPSKFANLFECKFVSDHNSVFKLATLQRCMVDAWDVWQDFKPNAKRPLGDAPVWIGYDPSRSGDDSSLAVVAPPKVSGGKFRVIESLSFEDLDFDSQARQIKLMTTRYNVQGIAIDATGLGAAVYELVKEFYPRVKKLTYSVELKNELVLKALQVMNAGRLEFDAGETDIPYAFMTISQVTTGSGRQISYAAARTARTGHADKAWAIMHALSFERIQSIDSTGTGRKRSRVETF